MNHRESRSTHFCPGGLKPLSLALLTLGLCGAGSALAQATPAAKDDPSTTTVQKLDQIVITAGKRTEKLREVAGSVSAVQGSELEARGVKDQEELFKLTPGVQYNKLGGDNSQISIRGITTSTGDGSVPSTTGFYIEDVPFNDPYIFRTSPDIEPFDLARVEILRGPQGVLYGSSSMGGAVRYLFNRPNLKRNEFSLLGGVSSTGGGGTNHREHVMGNVAVSDQVGVRLVLSNREESGYVDNPLLGLKDTNQLHQSGGRVLATFAPTRELSVTALYLKQTSQTDDGANINDLATGSKSAAALSPRKSEVELASLQVDYDVGPLRLTSNTARLGKDWTGTTDASRLAAFFGPGAYASFNEHSNATSQEFRIAGRDGGPLNWLAGVFFQKFKANLDDAINAPAINYVIPSVIVSDATERAVFVQGDYTFDNGLSLGAGARYYNTKNTVLAQVAGAPTVLESSQNGVTPRVSLKYKFNGDNLIYGLISKGYRFGGSNPLQFTPNPAAPAFVTPGTFKSDSLINYEAGLRLSPARSVRVDATLFLLDWTDLQLAVPRPGDGYTYITNVGKAQSRGLELSATWTPSPELTLGTAVALTDAKTRADYVSASGTAPSGTRLPGTARVQVTNQATYHFEGPLQTSGTAALTHSHVGKSTNDLFKSVEQGGYDQFDARLSFSNDHWELGLFASNLTNRKSVVGAAVTPGISTDYYILKPRTVGVTLRYDL